VVADCFDWYGRIVHGHTVIGMENIPRQGPALIAYYHGISPVDFFFAHSRIYKRTGRYMKIVAERFLFKIPGFGTMMRVVDAWPGSVQSGIDKLNQGHVLFVAPGGLREGYKSGHAYELVWGARCGFAKIAHAARAPIIPMFTTNSQEVLVRFPLFRRSTMHIYDSYGFPLLPMFGLFPVRMITCIGEPVEHDDSRTPEQLRDLVKSKLEELIERHQRLPGSIRRGILERFMSPASIFKSNAAHNENLKSK
jgi:1-acyl-sn-glycerol-3-phosphate acyltransferase